MKGDHIWMCGNWEYLGAGKKAVLEKRLSEEKTNEEKEIWREKKQMVWFGLKEAVSRKSINENLAGDWVQKNRPNQRIWISGKELRCIPL